MNRLKKPGNESANEIDDNGMVMQKSHLRHREHDCLIELKIERKDTLTNRRQQQVETSKSVVRICRKACRKENQGRGLVGREAVKQSTAHLDSKSPIPRSCTREPK
jgi:hypothetical protein